MPINSNPSLQENINKYIEYGKKPLQGLIDFLKSKKNDSRVMIVMAIIAVCTAVYFLLMVLKNISDLNKKIPQLINIDSYNTQVLSSNPITAKIIKDIDTLYDLTQANAELQSGIVSYTQYLQELQVPYTYFLQYLYLPSLNIWRNPYTQEIDTDIIGMKFLQQNPYNDISLLQKRSDFFKNVGDNNESNEVSDISVGDIAETDGYFSMPINVTFIANSKRAFLLLVDKLSMTSNKENISLINEFMYYLWQEIKQDKQQELATLTQTYSTLTGFDQEINQDKVIAYSLYNRIFHDKENPLIDKDVLNRTIKNVVVCNEQNDETCYYLFREKYRNIPTFGYLVGTDFSTDPAQNFKKFMLNFPPIFSIKQFTFDKVKATPLADDKTTTYKGQITIEVYGRGISDKEIQDIAQMLGNNCFENKQAISVDRALATVTATINDLTALNRINTTQSDDLRQLKNTLLKIQTDYPNISPYKKTIKLFEMYRMINEAGLCK